MIRIFKHFIPKSVLLLAAIEWLLLGTVIDIAARLRYFQADLVISPFNARFVETLTFVVVVYVAMVSFGLYKSDIVRDLRSTAFRLVVALGVSLAVLALIFFLLPDVVIWRSILAIAMALAFLVILLTRMIFTRVADLNRFKQRILVIGAGEQAARLAQHERDGELRNYAIIGFFPVAGERRCVGNDRIFGNGDSWKDVVDREGIHEIVIAVTERRGALPLADLLACRVAGCRVLDNVSFLERVRGYVDLDTLQPSWLIFSDGFVGGSPRDRILKRVFDIVAALAIFIATLPLIFLACIAVQVTSKGPLFYRQERVGRDGRTFEVVKFRSMHVDAEADGVPKWASEEDPRITPIGNFLRATRIDELPQLFNVIKGEMSFVGPRPERPFFVDSLVSQIPFFNQRHFVKPGITGWAQLNYPYGASVEDSKRKLEYDLYYVKNYSVFLDFLILAQTVRVVLWPEGVR